MRIGSKNRTEVIGFGFYLYFCFVFVCTSIAGCSADMPMPFKGLLLTNGSQKSMKLYTNVELNFLCDPLKSIMQLSSIFA